MMSAEGPGRQAGPQIPWLEVGRVARPHGLQGEVIVDLVTNRTERLDTGSQLSTGDRELKVLRSSPHQGRYIVAFAGVSTRDAADALRGAVLSAPAMQDPDALWAHDLVGARVLDPTGRLLGRVVALEANPASDLLVLEAGGLVPLCFVVEHTHGAVVVDPPAGLLDAPAQGPSNDGATPAGGEADGARERGRLSRGHVDRGHVDRGHVGQEDPAEAGRERPLRVDVFTIFPHMIEQWCRQSIMGRAIGLGLLDIRAQDLRSTAAEPHRSVDDAPFGGGAGMVLAPRPLFGAVEAVSPARPLYLLGPGGRVLDQAMARDLAGSSAGGFSLLCGRYEGVDQRVADHLVDGELSIGDYVLAGGEVAALVVLEAVTRLVPGVMGNQGSAEEESFGADGLLEAPQYTRPAEFRGWEVPETLVSGDHARIARWRRAQSLARTLFRRPDLIEARGGLEPEEVRLLEELGLELGSGHEGP